MNPIVTWAIPYVLPLFLGSATAYVYQNLKKASDWLDNSAPPQLHTIVNSLVAIGLPMLATVFPAVQGTTSLGGITPAMIQSALALIAGQITHAKLSNTPPKQ